VIATALEDNNTKLDRIVCFDEFDPVLEANQTAQASAGHSGVPLCVFDGEPFFGQDRLALLQWRLQQQDVTRR